MQTVGSLFAGVGGIDQGFEAAGFDIRWQVEMDADAAGVLADHWPSARRYRDVRHIGAAATVVASAARIKALSWPVGARSIDALAIARANVVEPTDWIVGGFPCQDVSVAGKRKGLIGARTGLFWEFMRIADELKPKGLLLENVPGLLSSHRGRDFQTVLGALAERGFRRAYRILDSQYFGVPQRRRRVFIVGCARASGLDPRAILFESVGGEGDPTPGRATRPSTAVSLRGRSSRAGVRSPGRGGEDDQNIIAFDTTQITSAENRSRPDVGRPSHPLSASAHAPSIAFTLPAVHRGVGQGHNTNYLPVVGPVSGGDHGSGRRSMDDANFVYPLSADAASGRSGEADTPSADAEGRVRLRPPSLGVGAVGAPSFTLSAGAVPAIAAISDQQHRARLCDCGHSEDDHDTVFKAVDPNEPCRLCSCINPVWVRDVAATWQGAGHSAQPEPGSGLVFTELGAGHQTYQATDRTGSLRGTAGGGSQMANIVASSGERERALVGSMHKRHDDDTDTLIAQPVYSLGSHAGAADGDATNRSHGSGGPVGLGITEGSSNSLRAGRPSNIGGVTSGVRRLTPLECERLQGYPDGWTCRCGKGYLGSQHCTCPDTPRYKQCGNGVSAPVAEWIARRIAETVA